MRKILLILIAVINGVQGLEPAEVLNSLVNAINCSPNANTTVANVEVLTAYQICSRDVDMHDGTCMFPCIATQMGLIVEGKLIPHAVSRYISSQFKNLDTAKDKNWTDGITDCFNQYESSGGKFPTKYKDCYQETQGLLNLATCILHARDCSSRQLDAMLAGSMAARQRKKRSLELVKKFGIVALWASAFGIGYLTGSALDNSRKCGSSGCYKGFCYAYCGLTNSGGDWCYTTRTSSQSYVYVNCKSNKECDGCWNCAGSCTL